MNNSFDFEQMFEDYLNMPIMDQLRIANFDFTHITVDVKLGKDGFQKTDGKIVIDSDYNELKNSFQNEYKEIADFDHFYILGIDNRGLRFAQFSHNYLYDELLNIKTFLEGNTKTFYKRLQYLYFIDEKHKYKYVEKAKKKNKPTIYFNDEFGSKILNYVNGEYKDMLADKYGMQNYLIENITELDNLKKKFIIILSFDVDMFEIYYSIPFEMHQKGSANLENDLVYCCRLDEIDPGKIVAYLNEHSENYL